MYLSVVASCTSVFFFQAEDGIRDGRVTGVQTCALPIYYPSEHRADQDIERVMLSYVDLRIADERRPKPQPYRSEERRVGKECRSRCSPEQSKKKRNECHE